jgi:DNA-binding CsgD family transcriptional regulator
VVAARCEIAWFAGDLPAAHREAERIWRVAPASESPWGRGMVATWLPPDVVVDGPPLAAPYELERAGRWLEAAREWERLESPFQQALALARSLDGPAVARSVTLFEAIGAEGAAARSRALLRAQGLPAPRSPRPVTRAHPAGLTARQAEVLALVGEGLSDAEIADRLVLSHRTVQNHTQNVLAKLQLHNRVELARYAIERGLDDPAC